MKEIKFSGSQFRFLVDNFSYLTIFPDRCTTRYYNVDVFLTIDEIECLLDDLGSLLSEKGLKENSETNEFGYFIESIIDPLSEALYD